jgi:hypothetical protein
MAFANGGRIVTNGLVLSLDAADQNSYVSGSATWNDLSGNGLNAVPTGSGFPAYNAGNSGNLVFINNPLSVGNSSILNLTNLTLSVWFKSTNTNNQILIGKSYTTSYYLNMAAAANTFSLWTNNSEFATTGILTLGNGNWHNILVTMFGTTKTSYYDGVQAATGTGTIPTTDSFNLVIGNQGNSNYTAPFTGSMANVQIYNRALSASEVTQNYNAQKSRFNLT